MKNKKTKKLRQVSNLPLKDNVNLNETKAHHQLLHSLNKLSMNMKCLSRGHSSCRISIFAYSEFRFK